MNFATALLDRLVPGRGSSEGSETAPAEGNGEPATDLASDDEIEPTGELSHPDPPIVERDISDEDVVLRQLIAHGGRVSRSTLAEETGWAESDLDDVLRGMEVDEQISTIRRRDPLVCRRGFEPAGAPLRFKND